MAEQLLFGLAAPLLAGLAICGLLAGRAADRGRRLLRMAVAGSLTGFAILAGPWAFTSVHLRLPVAVLFAGAAIHAWRRAATGTAGPAPAAHMRTPVRIVVRRAATWLLLLAFSALSVLAVGSRWPPRQVVDLAFPLSNGRYVVLQGGHGIVTNTFHTLAGSPLALDLVKLNRFGSRARGLAPSALEQYEIFGEPVLSPCTGVVVAARGHLPDHPPGKPDLRQTEGNFVTVACTRPVATVLLAHLQQGSVPVRPGEAVASGQPLGRVGNSGNTLEPHLHLDAVVDGKPAGVTFAGRWLTANDQISAAK